MCSMKDAHQIYPKLGLLANVGLVVSGRLISYVNTHLAGAWGFLGGGAVGRLARPLKAPAAPKPRHATQLATLCQPPHPCWLACLLDGLPAPTPDPRP